MGSPSLSLAQKAIYVLSVSPATDHIRLGTKAYRRVDAPRAPGESKSKSRGHCLTCVYYSGNVALKLRRRRGIAIVHRRDIAPDQIRSLLDTT